MTGEGNNRRPRAGAARGTDPQRLERNARLPANGYEVGPGLSFWKKALLQIRLGRAMRFDAHGGIEPRVDGEFLAIEAGSLSRIVFQAQSQAAMRQILETAEPTTADIKDSDGRLLSENLSEGRNQLDSTTEAVLALQTDKQNRSEKDTASGYAGLESHGFLQYAEFPWHAYQVDLSRGLGQLVTSDWTDLRDFNTAAIWFQRLTFGASPGHLRYTRTSVDTLDFESSDPDDDGSIEVIIAGIPQ